MGQVIALDVGGTHSRAALFDDAQIVWRDSVPTPSQQGPEAMLAAMLGLLAPLRDIDAPLGVAIAGRVVDGCVTADTPALVRGWHAFPLARTLAERLARPVRVLNDARAAAWGEFCFGAGRGCSEFLFVTVSSRITGQIGASSNPISGMTVATVLLTALIFLAIGWTGVEHRVLALTIGGVVCVAAPDHPPADRFHGRFPVGPSSAFFDCPT